VHVANVPELKILVTGLIFRRPTSLKVNIVARFTRELTFSVYRWPGGTSPNLGALSPLLTRRVPHLAGAHAFGYETVLELEKPGTYTVEVGSGQAVARTDVLVAPTHP
jgi:hypothetical protein